MFMIRYVLYISGKKDSMSLISEPDYGISMFRLALSASEWQALQCADYPDDREILSSDLVPEWLAFC